MNRGAYNNSVQQSRLSDFGFPGIDFRRNRFPLQATCISCGRQRWLNWVVKESHVCDECKEHLTALKNG
ncbi:MAG: hypothetical protein V1703_04975 [Candidatus Altiarchaeota archaeon]